MVQKQKEWISSKHNWNMEQQKYTKIPNEMDKASFKNLNQENWKGIARESKRTNTKVFILLTIKVNRSPYHPYCYRFGVHPVHPFSFFVSSLLSSADSICLPACQPVSGLAYYREHAMLPFPWPCFLHPNAWEATILNRRYTMKFLWLGRYEHLELVDLVTVDYQVLRPVTRMHRSFTGAR